MSGEDGGQLGQLGQLKLEGQLDTSYEARDASHSSADDEDGGEEEEGGGEEEVVGGELSAWGICAECQCLVCTCAPQNTDASTSGARVGGAKRKPLKRKNNEDEQPKKPVHTPSASAEGGRAVSVHALQGVESREWRCAEMVQCAWRGRVARCKVVRAKEVSVRNAAVCMCC